MVASNYFVQRMQNGYASGVLTARCSTNSIRVLKNTMFSVDGTAFMAEKAIIAMLQPRQDTDTVNYVRMVTVDGVNYCSIPVRAAQPGFVQIPKGVAASTTSYITGLQQLSVTSPITGGYSVQTDAQMMQRCLKKCGAAVGTQNAIWTRLQDSPVNVISCRAIGSADAGCFRSRYNNLDIPAGGIVDVYVKTQNQASTQTINIVLAQSTDTVVIDPDSYPDIKGFVRVSGVRLSSGVLPDYTITYGSSDTSLSGQGARLSVKQIATIQFAQPLQTGVTVYVDVQYMPGIQQVQQYIENQDIAFLGQSTLIKSAVPVAVKLHGSVHSEKVITAQQLAEMKQTLAKFICSKEVGDYTLNMTDISEMFRVSYPDAILRLPYNMEVIMPMKNGSLYVFETDSGIVDISYRKGLAVWDTAAYFFSSTPSYIDLAIV